MDAGSSTLRMSVASMSTATCEPGAELLDEHELQGHERREDDDHDRGRRCVVCERQRDRAVVP